MNKARARRLEFHITYTCNLNCQGCDAFSNYNITDHNQQWQDYEAVYAQWAQVLDIEEIGVQGGEPMANPDYRNWLTGLRRLWPHAWIWLATNGTLLHKKPHADLYDLCRELDIGLIVSLHNEATYEQDMDSLMQWLQGPVNEATFLEWKSGSHRQLQDHIKAYEAIRDPSWPQCRSYQEWLALPEPIRQECQQQHGFEFWDDTQMKQALADHSNIKTMLVDANQVKMQVKREWNFRTAPARVVGNRFVFSQSDPVRAHEACGQSMCHSFFQGALHKCPASHIFKSLVQEFDTDLTDSDRTLIQNYAPAQADWSRSDLDDFLQGLDNPISLCRLCPEQVEHFQVRAELGRKIHLIRRI